METEEPQDALGFLEVAVDDALQVRNAAETPVLEVLGFQELHADEDFPRRHHVAGSEQLVDGANDPLIVRVLPVVRLIHLSHKVSISEAYKPRDDRQFDDKNRIGVATVAA